jgi:hypothetical protein
MSRMKAITPIRHATMTNDRNRGKRQGHSMDVIDLTDAQWERNLTSYTSGGAYLKASKYDEAAFIEKTRGMSANDHLYLIAPDNASFCRF